jgi:SAM-dependent methyltransferase
LLIGSAMRRLNWACGPVGAPGWLNSDLNGGPGIEIVCDIRDGLPLEADSLEYAVSIHGLQDLPFLDVVPALQELHRVLRPDGVLRLGLPDLDRAIEAYRRGDGAYFYIPDEDAARLGAKLVAQIVWYGSVRTPFTFDFAAEALGRAGFRGVRRCAFRKTLSPFPEITALDNRERETLFVEAVK